MTEFLTDKELLLDQVEAVAPQNLTDYAPANYAVGALPGLEIAGPTYYGVPLELIQTDEGSLL